jgi:hypothetical protein
MYSEKEKLELLEHIWGETGTNSIIKSCAVLKISRDAYYDWLKDPKFAQIVSTYKKSYRQNACAFWLNKSKELYEDEETPPTVRLGIISLNVRVNGGFDKEEEQLAPESQEGHDVADIFANQMAEEEYQDLEPILEDDTEETPFELEEDDEDSEDD